MQIAQIIALYLNLSRLMKKKLYISSLVFKKLEYIVKYDNRHMFDSFIYMKDR